MELATVSSWSKSLAYRLDYKKNASKCNNPLVNRMREGPITVTNPDQDNLDLVQN